MKCNDKFKLGLIIIVGLMQISSARAQVKPEGGVVFDKQLGEALSDFKLSDFEGEWLGAIPEKTGRVQKVIPREIGEEFNLKGLFETTTSREVCSIRVFNVRSLVFGELVWNPNHGNFEARQQSWDVTTFENCLLIGADHGSGKLLMKIEFDQKSSEILIYFFRFEIFKKGFDAGALNGKINQAVDGPNWITISNDAKLKIFMEGLDVDKLFEAEPRKSYKLISNEIKVSQ